MRVYGFPGLGFDKRGFAPLQKELPEIEAMDWLPPDINESLSSYALRVGHRLELGNDCILIGHSLGGMFAQEIATQFNVAKVILISSIVHESENPWYFKALQTWGLRHFFSRRLTTWSLPLWGPIHDYVSKEEQQLFASMVHGHDRTYYQWALRELGVWKAPSLPKNLPMVRLHGTKDHTFPMDRLGPVDFKMANAGHFMLYRRASEIATILRQEISSLQQA